MNYFQTQVHEWISTFNLNHWIIEKQVEGINHEQSMLALPFQGNRMNWVVGHLCEHRDWMLRAVDGKTLMAAKDVMVYRRGSDPLTDESEVLQLDAMLESLRTSKDSLVSKVASADEAFLMETPQAGILMDSHKDKTRFQRLQGLLWHETYHLGQLELLRQLSGVNDKILT